MSSAGWDPGRYEQRHSYVWQFGAGLMELLQPRAGERILDVGCGTGQLTAQIASADADVVGLDQSAEMLDQARRNYPSLTFIQADAAAFHFDQPFDAVFSNAALHWVKNAAGAAHSIATALRPQGRFVAEFGGNGNIASILAALVHVLGAKAVGERSPWFYPGIAEYSAILEQHGLEVQQASLFDRPTPVEGENGMEDWLRMFCGAFFNTADQTDAIRDVAARLRPQIYRDGVWTLDYRRLRVVAVKAG